MSGEHILVVDDERDLADLVSINLDIAGYRTTVASDGSQALEAVARELPDLMLLDVMMPRLDGWGVLAALQEDERTRDLPVVMLTALSNERDVIRGHLSGAVRYVTKPFDIASLLTTVEEALQPLDDGQRTARRAQLRGFLTRLAELETGREGTEGRVRLSRLEAPPRPPTPPDPQASAVALLSPRQLEIARMLGAGWDARRIAVHLGTSRSNVYAARKRIARHLGVAPHEVAARAAELSLGAPEA
jgi:CheY-like chemotaxis protein/DNA-binding CsgD family transcriptional regulator